MMASVPHPIRVTDLASARDYISTFACPEGFSRFAWRQLQQTALAVWQAHLTSHPFRGSLHFCRPEFYTMLRQPSGEAIIPNGLMERFQAA